MKKAKEGKNLLRMRRVSKSIRILLALVGSALFLSAGGCWLATQLRQAAFLKAQQAQCEALLKARQRQASLNQQLLDALVKGNPGQALALVEAGANPNTRNSGKLTALMLACEGEWWNPTVEGIAAAQVSSRKSRNDPDDARLVQAMLAHRATLEAQDSFGRTALLVAASRNTRFDAKYNRLSAARRHVLALQQSAVVRLLLQAGANVQAVDAEGETALALAAQHDNTDVALQLLARGAKVNAAYGHESVLDLAADNDNLRIVRALLDKGAKVELPDTESLLVSTVNVAILALLLDHGADLHVRSRYGKHPEETVLMRAAWRGHVNTLRFWLARGVDINETNDDGTTALGMAACYADVNSVRFLLDHGARVNMPHCPVLFEAVENGTFDKGRLLLKRGAFVNTAGWRGRTALMRTAEWGNETFALELLRRGAHVNARDEDGQTALHLAAQDNNEAMVALLLAWGAEVNSRDKTGQTPLALAESAEEDCTEEVFVRLQKAGNKE